VTGSGRGFSSDNAATIHPEVLAAISRANVGHAQGYGHDPLSERAEGLVSEQLGSHARTFFVWGGTAANVLALRVACRPWQAAICAQTAHLNVDECGAPEAIAGVKLLTIQTADGKLTPEAVDGAIVRIGDEHAVQPRVLSVSQSTELGTVYDTAELRELCELAHSHGLIVQLDGARLSNAAATLGVELRETSSDVGIDILSFGGTKNGLLGAEAIVILDPSLADGFEYLRKQSMQLASKMRFLAAQFEALLTDELWRRLAAHANAMATRLAAGVSARGVTITQPVQSNAVFATLDGDVARTLQQQFPFYFWDEAHDEVRWMCSWDTTEQDVDRFVAALGAALGSVARTP
jgi:threonine aldolase